jgi:hypothetical protein
VGKGDVCALSRYPFADLNVFGHCGYDEYIA